MDTTVLPGEVAGTLTPPCSKSYAQRALAAALLCKGVSRIDNLQLCDDTRSALRMIGALGARWRFEGATLCVEGGLSPRTDRLDAGESGLAMRLFTPVAALCDRRVRIEGRGTLLERPTSMMASPLRQLGVSFADDAGRLPVEVCGPFTGGRAEVDASVSSQFLTGLLLALPASGREATLLVRGAVSTPYLDITVDTARRFGVEILHEDYSEFFIPAGQSYAPTLWAVESDWSAAAMLLAAGATAGRVRVEQLPPLSLQADRAVLEALERSGAGLEIEHEAVTVSRRRLRPFAFDATQCPDLFPALAALAAAADGVSEIRGTHRLRHKESDRAETLRSQYGRLGIAIDLSQDDTMIVHGGRVRGGRVDACRDHRIAMSLAVAALRADGPVRIVGAECVSKSYPGFFADLSRLGARIEHTTT